MSEFRPEHDPSAPSENSYVMLPPEVDVVRGDDQIEPSPLVDQTPLVPPDDRFPQLPVQEQGTARDTPENPDETPQQTPPPHEIESRAYSAEDYPEPSPPKESGDGGGSEPPTNEPPVPASPGPEDMPPFENVYRPTLPDVVDRIRTGTLSELTTDDSDGQVVVIDTRPEAEGGVWVGPDGVPVSSFMRKFQDGFEGWKPGEVVNATFILGRSGGQPELIVADAYVGDIRHSDTFALPEVSPEDAATLRNLGVALLDVDVEVISGSASGVGSESDYEARIRRFNSIQREWDGETLPQPGDQLLLKGKVVRYLPAEARERRADVSSLPPLPTVEIQLSNGITVPVQMIDGRITYHDGSLDLRYPDAPQQGDIVQVSTIFVDASFGRSDRVGVFQAPDCRSAYLVKPGAERFAIYRADRDDIAVKIRELSSLDGQAFHAAYAGLLHDYSDLSPGQPEPRVLLTAEEQQAVLELVEQKFPSDAQGNPPRDRPLVHFGVIPRMVATNEMYGVDTFAMSRQEFYDFCLDVANGRAPIVHGSEDKGPDTPFQVLHRGGFSPQEQFAVYKQTAEHWLAHIKGKEVVFYDRELVDPNRQVTYDAERMADRSVAYLGRVAESLPDARDYLYGLTIRTLRAGAAEDIFAIDGAPAGELLSHTMCSALERVAASAAVRDKEYGWLGIKDPGGLNYFVEKLPELRELAAAGDRVTMQEVHALIGRIVELNKLPPYTA